MPTTKGQAGAPANNACPDCGQRLTTGAHDHAPRMFAQISSIDRGTKPNWARATRAIEKLQRTWLREATGDQAKAGIAARVNELHAFLKFFCDGWEETSSYEFVRIDVGDKWVMVTGGMADPYEVQQPDKPFGIPTRAYDVIVTLEEAGVTKAAGFDD
jgi:hypothetical protein